MAQNALLAFAKALESGPSRELQIPFDRVSPEDIAPSVQALIEQSRARLDAITKADDAGSYDRVAGALERATLELEVVTELIEHLEGTMTTPELRKEWGAVQPEVSRFFSELGASDTLYRALCRFAESGALASCSKERRRFTDKMLAELRRNGASLDQGQREQLLAVDIRLSELTLKFGQNALDSQNAFDVVLPDTSRLSGLPDSALRAAEQSAASKGKSGFRFTLQQPSYVPALTYLDDAELRAHLYHAQVTRATAAPYDNTELAREILALRKRRAEILGFATFADLATSDRMAKSAKTARAFVDDLAERTRGAFLRENDELLRFRAEIGGGEGPMLPSDIAYFTEKQRRALYHFDAESLRAYFPLEQTLSGLFSIVRALYGLRFVAREGVSTWHPSIRVFEVLDEDSNVLGRVYLDPFPREQKRDGAWMHGLISALGPADMHQAVIALNFTPPDGGGEPRLRHSEVETLFHEFGHLLHHVCSKVPIRAIAGTNVPRDFVELPSQIFENWCWERDSLDLFAKHVETGRPIDDGLFASLRASRTFRAANFAMRQLGFATLDLVLHTTFNPETDDLLGVARDVAQRFSPTELPHDYAMLLSFAHLFASPVGYAAGYYSYKWAEVLDADAFDVFRDGGILNPIVGKKFRETILSRGDSDDASVLFRDFRGRDPSPDALLKRDGLL